MTVLVLTSSFPRYKGDHFGPWILNYTRELSRQGCRVIVIAPEVGVDPIGDFNSENHTVIRFSYWWPKSWQRLVHPPGIIPQLKKYPWLIVQLPFLLFGYWRTAKRIKKKTHVDVIHAQWVIPSGFIGAILKRKFNTPLAITSQGAEFYISTSHPFSWVTKWTIRKTDKLLPVSKMMAQRALLYCASDDQIEVLPNAVDNLTFHSQIATYFKKEHGIPEGAFVMLTVRRLVSEKRVSDVIDAFARVKEMLSLDVSTYLVIGGDGPERKSLEAYVRKKGIEANVIFLGFVDNGQLPPIYAASDIYVLSSEQEGLSLSLLEAMSSGCWVISTNSTGAEDVISDTQNGALYPTGDVEQLAEKILNRLQTMKKGNSERVSFLPKQFALREMISRQVSIYKEMKDAKTNHLNKDVISRGASTDQ